MDNYAHLRSVSFPNLASALGWNVSAFKKSNGDFVGPCFIHGSKNNKTCFRYHETGKFHCFSCEAKGSGALDLIKLVRQCGFKQAVEFLQGLSDYQPAQTLA